MEFALVIPGFVEQFDVGDLVRSIAPRELLLVSASEDKYSFDAEKIFRTTKEA